jgi:hypothetical protein
MLYRGNRGPFHVLPKEMIVPLGHMSGRMLVENGFKHPHQRTLGNEWRFYERFCQTRSSILEGDPGDVVGPSANFVTTKEIAQSWSIPHRDDRAKVADWAQQAYDQIFYLSVILKMKAPKGTKLFMDEFRGLDFGTMAVIPHREILKVPSETFVHSIRIGDRWYRGDHPRARAYYEAMVNFYAGGQKILASFPENLPLKELEPRMREHILKHLPAPFEDEAP